MSPYYLTQIGPWYAGRSRDEAIRIEPYELAESAMDVGRLAFCVPPRAKAGTVRATSEIRPWRLGKWPDKRGKNKDRCHTVPIDIPICIASDIWYKKQQLHNSQSVYIISLEL